MANFVLHRGNPFERSTVYGGILTKETGKEIKVPLGLSFSVINMEKKSISEVKSPDLTFTICRPLRIIAFQKELHSGLANDLLFTSPKYGIEGTENIGEMFPKVSISSVGNLENVLKFMGYGEEMTSEQLFDFIKNMTNPDYFKRIARLYGLVEQKDGSVEFIESEQVIDDDSFCTICHMAETAKYSPSRLEPYHKNIKRR